jgi:hypothetical protein
MRLWEALSWTLENEPKYDYYVLTHDDSFICLDHLMHDSNYYPGPNVHIAHFRHCSADVIEIYGSELAFKSVEIMKRKPALRTQLLFDDFWDKNGHIRINELKLLYGAAKKNGVRYNDWEHGWVGTDLLTAAEKRNFCNVALTAHQVYPPLMYDLWNHIQLYSHNFTPPTLSRNCANLDSLKGF